jgi:hypothetical protein
MSDRLRGPVRRRVLACVGIVAIAGMPARGAGQEGAAQQSATLRARLAAAERAYLAATDSYHVQRDALLTARVPRDSVRGGGLTIQSARPLGGITRRTLQRSAERSWNIVRTALGDSASAATARLGLVYREDSGGTFLDPARGHIWLPRAPGRGNALMLPLSESAATADIVDLVGTLASLRNPAPIREWIGDWMPARRLETSDWEAVAVMLATMDAAVTRGCHAGSVAQCESALALTPVRDPLTEWYSREDWFVLASTHYVERSRAWNDTRDDCIVRHREDRCLQILRMSPAPLPIPVDARRSLVAYALERGGAGGFARLITATGTPLQILEQTSGLHADSLIAGWRTRVVSATPQSVRPRALEATLMLGWIFVFGIAAGRRRP